jgi:trimeric autotransporter adhesin
VGSEKLEVQSEYASVVNRCIAELNTMAAAAQSTLAAAGANPQQQLRTVPCPPHLALSIARLLRRLTREVGADLAYHSTSRLVAITGDDLDKVEEAAVAVEKLCATEQGCSSKEEEAAAQKREAAAAKARAAEAAKAKAADAAAAAAVLAAATAAADKAHHGHAHAHSNSKHSSKDHKDKSSNSDHHHHRDHRHGSDDSATTAGTALPPKGHRERGERGGRRSRPPLAPLRTESDTSNHEHEQSSLGSGPPSYTPSESGSVGGTMMRTAALDSSEGADSPRAASVSSSSAGGGCCCASPVVAEMLRNGSTDSLFTEGSAPWTGISFSFSSSSSSSGSGSNSSSSNDSSSSGSGGAAAAATGGGPCWDYYRQSWADNGASEQELLLSCASEHALDLSTVSFVPPPVRGHVIAASSGNSGGAAAAANALQMPPRPPALEPGLERAVFELLNALELAKYAPAFSNAEVRNYVCVCYSWLQFD